MVNVSRLIHLSDYFLCLSLCHAETFHAVFHPVLIRCIDEYMHAVLTLPQNVVGAAPYHNAGLFIRQLPYDTDLIFKDLILFVVFSHAKPDARPF